MKPAAAEPACLAVDLHVHTGLSPDSLTALPAIVEAVCARGLSALAITDHNEVDAALRLQEVAPFPVIVGEEVKTTQGEIIGLFLQRRVPKNMSPQETIAAIRGELGDDAPPIIVGGNAFRIDEELWKTVGADMYARDAAEALELLRPLRD